MTRILIADDHPIFRAGLRRLLESEDDFTVCGEAADGSQAVSLMQQLRPDLLLLDVSMPGTGGLEALRELSATTTSKVLLLTGAIDQTQLVTALQLGARGVVMKDSQAPVLVKAIRSVMIGEFWVGRDRVASLVEALRPRARRLDQPSADYGLTRRELLLIAGVVEAYSNRDIGLRLAITEKTVKRHLTNVFDKLGVSTRVELAMFAVRHGLELPDFPPAAG